LILEKSPDSDPGRLLFILQRGSVELTIQNPTPAEVTLRSLGPGAVFGHLPESGFTFEEGRVVGRSDGELLLLSVADWQYLQVNQLWQV
ncbi:MAG: hypothetical protein AAF633_15505, partial [Chloroflexota bacterium]